MKYYRKVIFILLITTQLLTISCLPAYRSAKGLDKGEIHAAYNAPTGGNIRYGIHDSIETRITYEEMLGLYGFDIFTHFHPSLFDFGFGASYSYSDDENTSEFDIIL